MANTYDFDKDRGKGRSSDPWLGIVVLVIIGIAGVFLVRSCDISSSGVRPSPPSVQSQPRSQKEWYSGGTLHTALVGEWKNATQQNRLATCADFAIGCLKRDGVEITSMGQLLPHAIALEICISEGGADAHSDHLKVVELAAACWILMKQ